jgi:tetratricopeptide (TPR) repeat protein
MKLTDLVKDEKLGLVRSAEIIVKSRKSGVLPDYHAALELFNQVGPLEEVMEGDALADAYLQRGVANWKVRNQEEAIGDLRNSIDLKANIDVHWRLSQYLAEVGKLEEAIPSIDEVIKLEPDNPDFYATRAMFKHKAGDFIGAQGDLSSALELDPNNSVLLHERGYTKSRNADFIEIAEYSSVQQEINGLNKANLLRLEAIKDFDQAIALNESCAVHYAYRANVKLQLDMVPEASEDYELALELSDGLVDLSPRNAIHAFIHANKYDLAVSLVEDALDLIEDYGPDEEAHTRLLVGKAFLGAENFTEAEEQLELVLELNPRSTKAHCWLSDISVNRGDIAAAINHYDLAIEIEPEISTFYFLRGNLVAQVGNVTAAIEDFSKAVELEPQIASYYAFRGECYASLGQNEEAIVDFESAISLEPDRFDTLYNKASMLERAGLMDEARNAYQHTLDRYKKIESKELSETDLSILRATSEGLERLGVPTNGVTDLVKSGLKGLN